MHDIHEFLRNLALVLGVAAVTTLLFQRLRQPVVFGYMLAGVIVGPHVPIPLAADEATIRTLSELGVILLMFALGLEFSLRKLFQVGPTAGIVAVLQSTAMVAIGYLLGRAFGWSALESVYAGAVIAISSTTIIIKAFAEQGVRGRVTEIVFGVLIIEDLIGIFLIAILTPLSAGAGVSAGELAATAGRLFAFLGVLIAVGLLTVPRLVRTVVRLNRPETTVVAAVGICFVVSYLAHAFGYSVALGAFVAGSLVAESGHEKTVEHLVGPVRDVFAAIFFVSVGMLIDPRIILEHWGAVAAFTVAVIVGKVLAVSVGAFLAGYGTRTSVRAGMSLAQIGEFSFIIAGVGIATGATGNFLYPVAVAVSAITTLSTPWLIRSADVAASFVDRKLPRPLQTFVALYGSWMEALRSAPRDRHERSRERRLVGILALDALLLAGIVLGLTRGLDAMTSALAARADLSPEAAHLAILAATALVAAPLTFGLVRSTRALGKRLANRALPAPAPGRVDPARAPRRAFVVTWQLMLVMLVALPIIALLRPVVPPAATGAALATGLAVLAIAFWRSATDLEAHTRAGAEVILAALGSQMAAAPQRVAMHEPVPPEPAPGRPVPAIDELVPGLGAPVSFHLEPGDYAVGRSLAELDLRDRTDAAVLAISRRGENIVLPVGRQRLEAGDMLALAGTTEAVEAARQLLRLGPDYEAGPHAPAA